MSKNFVDEIIRINKMYYGSVDVILNELIFDNIRFVIFKHQCKNCRIDSHVTFNAILIDDSNKYDIDCDEKIEYLLILCNLAKVRNIKFSYLNNLHIHILTKKDDLPHIEPWGLDESPQDLFHVIKFYVQSTLNA